MNQWGDSRYHLDRAIVLAVEADDPARLATALSFAAYRAMCTNDIRSASSLSDAAARSSGLVDVGLRTYMTLQRAEVAAFDDNRHEASRLLANADHLIDRLPSADELPDSGYWYTPAVLLGHKGFVLRALGDLSAARRAAADSLAAMPPTWRNSEWAAQHRALADG